MDDDPNVSTIIGFYAGNLLHDTKLVVVVLHVHVENRWQRNNVIPGSGKRRPMCVPQGGPYYQHAHQACHHHQRATWAANNTTNYDYTQYIIMSCRVLEDIGLSGQRKLNPLKLSPRIRFGPNSSFAVSSGRRKFGYIITGKKNYIIPGHTHIHRRRECGRRSKGDVEEEEIVCHEIYH